MLDSFRFGDAVARRPESDAAEADRQAIRALKARFDDAHAQGMDALYRRDLGALELAIRRERELIDEQRRLILQRLHRVSTWRR